VYVPLQCKPNLQTLLSLPGIITLAVWLSGNALTLINIVALQRARLVLEWVIVSGYTILVFNKPPRPTQPGHPYVGRHSDYWRNGELVKLTLHQLIKGMSSLTTNLAVCEKIFFVCFFFFFFFFVLCLSNFVDVLIYSQDRGYACDAKHYLCACYKLCLRLRFT